MTSLVALLFIANTINIGADLAAMGAAAELVLGWGRHLFTLVFAVASLTVQVLVPYHRYVLYLKWLTLVLFAYVGVVFTIEIDWSETALRVVTPQLALTRETAIMVVAVFGTTISPYLLFWQASEEVEAKPTRQPIHSSTIPSKRSSSLAASAGTHTSAWLSPTSSPSSSS